MAPEAVDLLVVGAGPTGLTLALSAAAHGTTVRVIERRPERFRPSRALIVHPRTLEVLRPLGVTGALLERGDASPSARIHLRSRVVAADIGDFDLPDTAFPHLLLIGQAAVEDVLAGALADRGVEAERGTEAVGVSAGGDHATVATRSHGEIAARFVVGCDGPGSIVRESMGTTWSGGPYRQEVVLADLELDGDLEPGVVHAAPGPLGVVLLFALGEQATWRLLATRPAGPRASAFGQPGPPVAIGDLQALLDRSGLAATVAGAAWSARVPLQRRIAGTYRKGRLFVAGDAAHSHSPAGGQGMNTGIQDAANLGWKLAFAARGDGGTAGPLLDSYEAERRPVARRVLAMTHAIFWAEAGTDPLARAVRAAVAAAGAPVLPPLLRRRRLVAEGVRTLGQLRVDYGCSPLSVSGARPARGLPLPGARLGDPRLQALTARPGVHLLLQRDASPPALDLVDVHRLDVPGTGIAAVRPDGYVGFSGDCSEDDLLRAWLSLIGRRAGSVAVA